MIKVKRTTSSSCGCWGLAIGIVLFILCVTLVPVIYFSIKVEDTWFVPGDASHFDPITAYDEVHKHAGDNTQLISISAYYVRSDGTLDLNADYHPYVDYKFVRILDKPPKDAPPVGAGGSAEGIWFEDVTVSLSDPWQTRSVKGSTSYTYVNLGMQRETNDPRSGTPGTIIEKPGCSFKLLWEKALEEGAKSDAVATITYDAEGYDFSISGTNIDLQFNQVCDLVSGR